MAVMGTMGSGKTTAARIISGHLSLKLLDENFDDNLFLPRFYSDMKRWAFHSQLFFLMEKIRLTLDCVAMLKTGGIVQDTPLVQDVYSYAKAQYILGNMDDAEWNLYMKLFHRFELTLRKPDIIIYLSVSPEELMERIQKRGREYEQSVDPEYIRLLDRLNTEWIEQNTAIPVYTIDTTHLNVVQNRSARLEFLHQVSLQL